MILGLEHCHANGIDWPAINKRVSPEATLFNETQLLIEMKSSLIACDDPQVNSLQIKGIKPMVKQLGDSAGPRALPKYFSEINPELCLLPQRIDIA